MNTTRRTTMFSGTYDACWAYINGRTFRTGELPVVTPVHNNPNPIVTHEVQILEPASRLRDATDIIRELTELNEWSDVRPLKAKAKQFLGGAS